MSATADAIARISLDETLHYALVANLIRRLQSDPDWTYIFANNHDEFYAMYKAAAEADYKWIEYLFEDKPQLLGISEQALKQYVRFNTNRVLRVIGYEPLYDPTTNPCSWADKYDKLGSFDVSQKEKVSGNYTLGALNRTMSSVDWDKLKGVQ